MMRRRSRLWACLPNDLNEDGRVDLLVYYWGRTPVTFLNQQEKALEPTFRT